MDKKEIAEALRREVGQLEATIKKTSDRCERLKRFVLDLEDEIEAAEGKKKTPAPVAESKFRKAIDAVFGEEPKIRSK
jgi:predicted nuclease with TOPRIM domain